MITWSRTLPGPVPLVVACGAAAGLALVVGALSAALPSLVARVVLGACVAGLFVRYPFALVLTWGGLAMFGNNRLDVLGGQSIFGALTYLSLPCFALVGLPRLGRLIRTHPWLGIWVAFVLLVFINLPRSPLDLSEAARQFIGYPATIGIFVLAVTELTTRRRAAWLTWIVLMPAAAIGAYGVYQYVAGVGGYDSQGVYRVFSIFSWTNTLAFFLIVPLGWAAYIVRDAPTLRVRLSAAALLVVLGACEFFTFGRGGWLGAALAVGGPLLIVGPPARVSLSRPMTLALGLIVLAVGVTLLPGLDLSERVEDVANLQGRAMIWEYVFRRAMDDPIIGQGFEAATEVTAMAVDDLVSQGVHNTYLMVFFDFGAIGLAIFCAAFAGLFARLVQDARRAADRRTLRLRMAAAFTTLGVLVYSGSGLELVDFAPSIYLWLMLGWTLRPIGAEVASGAGGLQLPRRRQPAEIQAREHATEDQQLQPLGTR
jgi:O-antigen ligase